MKKLLTVLSLAFVFICSCIPLSASASPIVEGVVLNPPYTEGYAKHWYFVFEYQGYYHLWEYGSNDYTSEPKLQVNKERTKITHWNSLPTGFCQMYIWDDLTMSWDKNGGISTSQSYRNSNFDITQMEIIKSDVNILDYDGTVFFLPRPFYLMKTTGEMTGAISMKSLWKTMVGNLEIVTLFGVGLLALVIGLKIFGKISKIFRI